LQIPNGGNSPAFLPWSKGVLAMTHHLLLNLSPDFFAVLVVAVMAIGGMALGWLWSCAFYRIGERRKLQGGSE